MTKKKKSENGVHLQSSEPGLQPPAAPDSVHSKPSTPAIPSKPGKTKKPDPSASSLVICRNKHWRYISSFHGPWLQLPPEILESLAHSNYYSPRPHPIDPSVFYDLVKIRREVDDATDLAVRAASGVASSSLHNSHNASNGIFGGGSAAALGLGIGGGGNAKLSRERKHRMRELATQKLSSAYHLDEIAASVATMQSASALEDVANLVLQRSQTDSDAKYVHFFHEKIPSRMLAECTSLQPLDEIISTQPNEAAPLRTRAVTRVFKDDYMGAAKDLTDALASHRFWMAQHRAGSMEIELAAAAQKKIWRQESKIDEKDHPNSLEGQLLFHRAGVYLALACQHVGAALQKPSSIDGHKEGANGAQTAEMLSKSPEEEQAELRRIQARKVVKTNAKRALRDYIAFLSSFDYTPGLPAEVTEEFLRKVNYAANGNTKARSYFSPRQLESSGHHEEPNGHGSNALVAHKNPHRRFQNGAPGLDEQEMPPPVVHQVSALFSATPPPGLPPYPSTALALAPKSQNQFHTNTTSPADTHEAVTYHPLLTDALHSLLLCHCLVQTSPKELLRHAHNVARLARICDGYPIFLASRSPSRTDWIEVIRRTNNWISLQDSWESLCAPAPLPGQSPAPNQKQETEEEVRERRKHEAILEALADERVHDEESFQAAVAAREKRAEEDTKRDTEPNKQSQASNNTPKRWAQEDGREYPITTERAEAVARWVLEAPLGGTEGASKPKRSGKRGKTRKPAGVESISESVASLSVTSEKVDSEGGAEEDVD